MLNRFFSAAWAVWTTLNPSSTRISVSNLLAVCHTILIVLFCRKVYGIFFFFDNFIYKTITYTTYSINYTYIVLATYTTDTYTYTNYAYTTLRYMYYNTININLIYGWRVYKVLFN